MSLSVVILLLRRGAIADSLDTDGKVVHIYVRSIHVHIVHVHDIVYMYRIIDVFRVCLWFYCPWHGCYCMYIQYYTHVHTVHVHVRTCTCMCIMTMKSPTCIYTF